MTTFLKISDGTALLNVGHLATFKKIGAGSSLRERRPPDWTRQRQ
ncbi:hypothetical protein [Arthrobacter sp. Soil736]|nr:hypothetical protein [Arthrobacter sp. Soil736]